MIETVEKMAGVPDYVDSSVVCDFDFYNDKRYGDDLHASLEVLHQEAPPVFYTPRNGGHWVVTRYDEIAQIVQDPENFSVREMQIPRVPTPPFFIPLSLDPPDNMPFRMALMPSFSPKKIKDLEGKVRYWAKKIVDDVAEKGECDFMYDVAELFPVSIFMELMGMDLSRLREFRELANNFFNNQNNAEKLQSYVGQIIALMTEYIEEKRANPDDGLISQLLKSEINGRPISLEEMQNMCLLLFVGGMDTVANATGFAYNYLAHHPEIQQQLADDPSKATIFAEEAVRLFGVVHTPRIVARDCEKFGVKFKKDDMVLCMLPLAGRDDRVNDNPSMMDLSRKKPEYLTFSKGPHLCVGHFLGRSEIRILTEEWFKRVPSFRPKNGAMAKYRSSTVLAILSVPIEWDVK